MNYLSILIIMNIDSVRSILFENISDELLSIIKFDIVHGTLLENIPVELWNIIKINVNNIIITRIKTIQKNHKTNGYNCHAICHICKMREATFSLGKYSFELSYGNHPCCENCVRNKCYCKCEHCNKFMDMLRNNIHNIYSDKTTNDEELLIKIERRGRYNPSIKNCPICYVYHFDEPKCYGCGNKDDLIKCFHDSIRGQRIIYFCKNPECKPFIVKYIVEPENVDDWKFLKGKLLKRSFKKCTKRLS